MMDFDGRVARLMDDLPIRDKDRVDAGKAIRHELEQAYRDGQWHARSEEKSKVEERYWRETWEASIDRRLAAFVQLVGEQVTTPTMMRAAEVAAAVDSPASWAGDVVRVVRDTTVEDAKKVVDAARRQHGSASSAARRSRHGSDPLVAFVLGAMFL